MNRGVKSAAVWNWRNSNESGSAVPPKYGWLFVIGWGLLAGVVLGLCALWYRDILMSIPAIHELAEHDKELNVYANRGLWWLALLGIGFAPIAEEYLFRGLLYRALDRGWGGAKAIIGSAAFFAIYHPPLSWLPVGALGVLNAFIFKKTERLVPCVLCHMAYNAVVLLM